MEAGAGATGSAVTLADMVGFIWTVPVHYHLGPGLTVRARYRGRDNQARRETSRDNLFDHVAVNVGQAEIAAGVAVGEALVVEAQQV